MLNVKFIKENILSSHTVPKSLVSSTVGWTSIYFLIKKFTKKEPEWSVRLVTIVHATVVTMLSILDWSYIKQWDIDKLGQRNSTYEEFVLCLTLGYFFFDIGWMLKYQTEGPIMYFHHTSSILCLVVILAKGTSAFEVLVGISGLELTNPCLQARWFLRSYGYQGTWFYTLIELLFMVTFIAFRIFYGTYLTYHILNNSECNFVLKIGTICLYVVSWTFVYQMFIYVKKRYKNTKN